MSNLKEVINELCECEYPAGIEDIESKCKDVTVQLDDGSKTTLTEMLEILDNPPETFDSSDDLYNTMISLAPKGSVGRENYDDRGSNHSDREQRSF